MPFVAPRIRTLQCVDHTSFTPPPLDGSCTLPQAFDWHYSRSPEHIFYKYEGPDNVLVEINWKDAVSAVYRASNLLRSHANNDAKLAFLAVTDSLTFSAAIMGAIRAGFSPFVVSPRNSPEVIAQLLDKRGVSHLVHSNDAATAKLAHASTQHRTVSLIPMPSFSDLYNDEDVDPPPPVKPDLFSPAVLIHSSGSTSTPKLLPITHSTLYLMGMMGWANDVDIGNGTWNFAPLPMFHIMGIAQLPYAAYIGMKIAVFPPTSPPTPPTAENFLRCMEVTGCTSSMIMPSILETVSHNPEQIKILARLESLLYGGATLKPSVAERLTKAGVKLMSGYGMSETGTLSMVPKVSHGWQWIHLEYHIKPYFRDLEDGTHEFYVISHDMHHVDTVNCELDGHPALATKDVVVRHPTDPMAFRIVGRLDDVLILSTGEKTNAAPLEAILAGDPRVFRALIFGRDRPRNGVLIQPQPEYAFDPSDHQRLTEFRDAIWPTVEQMNEFAPSHSRLIKEARTFLLIFVTSPAKPLPINPTKGGVIRSLATSLYDEEISDAYDSFEKGDDLAVKPPPTWDLPHTEAFVKEIVKASVPDLPTGDSDFFTFGGDSLKAARIHNAIIGALRASGLPTESLPADIPYKYPTINSLSAFVSAVGSSNGSTIDTKALKVVELEAILAKYSQSFPVHAPAHDAVSDDKLVILVTGTTGGLGTNLLAQLLGNPHVDKVFALNRRGGSGGSLMERHKAGFLDRGVDPALLDVKKFVFLEGDTAHSDLGIEHAVYEEMRASVTHIIHNAWPVNFNFAVKTFESAIAGARNLVDLALRSTRRVPPRFMFISSIAVTRSLTGPNKLAPEEYVVDPAVVVGQGYAESKWVVERMLQLVSAQSSLSTVSVRVGQLAGGSNGSWNASDWVPVLARSATKLGCMPGAAPESLVSWVRVDSAAAAIIEMRDAEPGILHLVHPRPVPWNSVFQPLAEELHVPLVPFAEWLKRLAAFAEANPDGGNVVPAVWLLEFFRGLSFDADALSTTKSQAASPRLCDMPLLTNADVLSWIAYWRRIKVVN